MAGVPSRSRKTAVPALAALLAAMTGACADDRYMGISLDPAQDPALQTLARHARDGDRQAQFELAAQLERNGDLEGAERLYLIASLDRGGTRYAYSPPQSGDSRGGTTAVAQGPRSQGLPEARQAWIRVRSERLAQRASRRAPGHLALDAYIASRFTLEKRLGASGVPALGIRSINGPQILSGRFEPQATAPGSAEICAGLQRLMHRYFDHGFDDCDATRSTDANAQDVYLVYYTDRFDETLEGHPEDFHRPPFSIEDGLSLSEPICGRFLGFDLAFESGATYRLIISPTEESRRRQPDAASICDRIED